MEVVRPNRRNRTRQIMRVKGTDDRNGQRVRGAVRQNERAVLDRLSAPEVFQRYAAILEFMPEKPRAEWVERFVSHAHERGCQSRWSFAVSRTMRSHWKRALKLSENPQLAAGKRTPVRSGSQRVDRWLDKGDAVR